MKDISNEVKVHEEYIAANERGSKRTFGCFYFKRIRWLYAMKTLGVTISPRALTVFVWRTMYEVGWSK